MNKINGYTQEEASKLVEYICEGKGAGKTLSYLFDSYGKTHGRAKGSVRNYYYTLLKSKNDERVGRLLKGKNLSAEEIREFTDEETDEVLKKIILERSKGYSVRRAIRNIAGDDEKLMLRYQNKYRNILKKQPQRIETLMNKMGFSNGFVSDERRQLLHHRIENEINGLYNSIAKTLKSENERLTGENEQLKRQIELLRKKAK